MAAPLPILLSTAYLPPVQYVSKFMLNTPVFIERYENYQKQSYRNRCYIYGANGIQCLVIPVKKTHGEKTPVTEVEIDYSYPWTKIHVKTLESAYRLSPFFEYYAEEILAVYEQKIPQLFELNTTLLHSILGLLDIKSSLRFTASFEPAVSRDYDDFRYSVHPKNRLNRPDNSFTPFPYQQVFNERFGFLSNLSIIDLLFNEGPNARDIIRQSLKNKDLLQESNV